MTTTTDTPALPRRRLSLKWVVIAVLGVSLLLAGLWVCREKLILAYLSSRGMQFQPEVVYWPENWGDLWDRSSKWRRGPSHMGLKPTPANRGREGALLAWAGGLHSLKVITVSDPHPQPGDIQVLSRFPRLEVLNFVNCDLRGVDLSPLARVPDLVELNLQDCAVNDETLRQLSHCPKLGTLVMLSSESDLTAAGFRELSSYPGLKALILTGDQITDGMVSELRSCTELRTLVLDGTAVTDQCLSDLANLPKLQTVSLSMTDVDDAAIEEFQLQHPAISVTDD